MQMPSSYGPKVNKHLDHPGPKAEPGAGTSAKGQPIPIIQSHLWPFDLNPQNGHESAGALHVRQCYMIWGPSEALPELFSCRARLPEKG